MILKGPDSVPFCETELLVEIGGSLLSLGAQGWLPLPKTLTSAPAASWWAPGGPGGAPTGGHPQVDSCPGELQRQASAGNEGVV